MKAREPDIKVQRWVAMLQAADMVERDDHYRFNRVRLPNSCDDIGCVLGWIGFAAGLDYRHGFGCESPLDEVARWMGYSDQWDFYNHAMGPADSTLTWRHDSGIAAQTLRKLTEEMTA